MRTNKATQVLRTFLLSWLVVLNCSLLCYTLRSQDVSMQDGAKHAEDEWEVLSEFDFGSSPVGGTLHKTIRIPNPFGVTVEICSVERSCGCTDPRIKNASIPKDGEFEIDLGFSPGRREGEISKEVILRCTSGVRKFALKLVLKATVHGVVELRSKNIWYVDPSHVNEAQLEVLVVNFFIKGNVPKIDCDELGDSEIVCVEQPLPQSLSETGAVGVWKVRLKAPSKWLDEEQLPPIVRIVVSQEIDDKSVVAERSVFVRKGTCIVVRPNYVDLRKNGESLEFESIVNLANWSVEDFVVLCGTSKRVLSIEALKKGENRIEFRLPRISSSASLENENKVLAGFLSCNIFAELELKR